MTNKEIITEFESKKDLYFKKPFYLVDESSRIFVDEDIVYKDILEVLKTIVITGTEQNDFYFYFKDIVKKVYSKNYDIVNNNKKKDNLVSIAVKAVK